MDLEPRRKGFGVRQSSMTRRQRIALTVILLAMALPLVLAIVSMFAGG